MKLKSPLNLQTTVILLVCGVVILAMLVTHALIGYHVSQNAWTNLENKAMHIARTVAYSPALIEAMSGARAESEIQEYTMKVQEETDVNYIVVFDMDGIRKSHPDKEKIGLPFVGGDEGNVLSGEENISIAEGTLGQALRAFTPIYSNRGEQLGAVAVGISIQEVRQTVGESRSIIYIGMLFGTIIGIVGAIVLAKRIKRILFGLEPIEIAKIYEERNGMIQSMFEGVIAIDGSASVTLANTKALEFFSCAGIEGNPVGHPIDHYIPNLQLSKIVSSGETMRNQEFDLNGLTFLINCSPLYVNEKVVGAIVTLRDKTEVKKLAEQLIGVKIYADALRAQTHEFMNKLHVILGMVHMKYYDELTPYVSQIKKHFQEEVGFISKRIKDPVLAGFILAKMSYAREKGVRLSVLEESYIPESNDKEITHELVTIIGNLLNNAMDAIEDVDEKRIEVSFLMNRMRERITIEVTDTGHGISEAIVNKIFDKGFTMKKEGRGYGLFLLKQSVTKLDGHIEISSEVGKGTTFTIDLPYLCKDETL